jgi:glycerol-3-phosphate dehydrogenase
MIDDLIEDSDVDREVAFHLVETYGADAVEVLKIAGEEEGLSSRIVAGEPYLIAEARYAAKYQMAMKLIDFMFRRTQLAIRLKDHGRSVAGTIAREMANELGWSTQDCEKELIDFEKACALVEASRGV